MKQVKHFSVLLLALAVLFSANCTRQNKAKFSLMPSFKSIDIPLFSRDVDADKGGLIRFGNGSSIEIPPEAFEDENKKPVIGKVMIKYREFHDAADIITSGIPMNYDSAGTSYNFETAGMFEIKGEQKGKPVFIRGGKQLKVNLASFVGDENFNFYQLGEENGNWSFVGRNEVGQNTAKFEALDSINRIAPEPIEPQQDVKGKAIFDFDINYSNIPEFKEFHGIMWTYAGTTGESDPENNQWINKETWTTVSLTEDEQHPMTYKLSLGNATKSFHTIVKPVFSGKDLEKAQANFKTKMEEYQKKYAAIIEQRNRLQQQADFIRTVEVSGFGIYNYDRLYSQFNTLKVFAEFTCKDFDLRRLNAIVFLITGNNRVVVKYPNQVWGKFAFDPNADNKLITVLPNNKIAVFKNSQFREIDKSLFESHSGQPYVFELEVSDLTIDSPDKLKEIISQI